MNVTNTHIVIICEIVHSRFISEIVIIHISILRKPGNRLIYLKVRFLMRLIQVGSLVLQINNILSYHIVSCTQSVLICNKDNFLFSFEGQLCTLQQCSSFLKGIATVNMVVFFVKSNEKKLTKRESTHVNVHSCFYHEERVLSIELCTL